MSRKLITLSLGGVAAIILVTHMARFANAKTNENVQNQYFSEYKELTNYNESVDVYSISDFDKVNLGCELIEIKASLVNDEYKFVGINKNTTVKKLVVNGQISEGWMEKLVTALTSINILVLDLDKLCLGSTVTSMDFLPSLNLPSLETLILKNDSLCDISSWLYKWKLPNLRTIIMERIDFRLSSYRSIKRLLKSSKALKLAEFTDCKLCNLCDTVDLRRFNFVRLNCTRTIPLHELQLKADSSH